MEFNVVDAQITPQGRLEVLSRSEVGRLLDTRQGGLYGLFRNCALAVLNSGLGLDDGKELLERYKTFEITIRQRQRGILLDLKGAPARAFVDGQIIKGINEHLFAVVRDILYVDDEIRGNARLDLATSEGVTDAVFHILRNAEILKPTDSPKMVVCWGGHSISPEEYDYTKEVGYQLGLRGMDICTGCGPGSMKGPMKGAAIAHAKQRVDRGRYLGFTEPSIIAAESPNPIVNELVILPDVEKRLEAFVRAGHAIVVFPGGAGTAEEILYVLGILLHPDNAGIPFPLVFSGPEGAEHYFNRFDEFVGATLGPAAQRRYKIVIGDPGQVAREVVAGIELVRAFRKENRDAYYFNWLLKIDHEFQRPFIPSHASMRSLNLRRDQPAHELAANLRRAFCGVVTGNIREYGIRAIEEHGKFEIRGDPEIVKLMDSLLSSFVEQKRMKLPGPAYVPCYEIVA